MDTLNKHYNLKDVVLIDNSVLSFAYHLSNGIPIVPFIEQKDDTQLLMLAYYLVSIAGFDDLTVENKKHINLEHYLQEAEKLPEEESEEDDTINEEESKDANNIKQKIINEDNKTKENNEIKKEEKEERKGEKNKKRSTQRRKSKKLLSKRSEKKLAEDMKKDMDDIYKSNYN